MSQILRIAAAAGTVALLQACLSFSEDPAPAEGTAPTPPTSDTGTPPVTPDAGPVGEDTTIEVDERANTPELAGNLSLYSEAGSTDPLRPLPACEVAERIEWAAGYEIAGCGIVVEPPFWQLPDRRGTGGMIDTVMSCADRGTDERIMHTHVSFPIADASTSISMLWMTGSDNYQSDVRMGYDPDDLFLHARGFSFTYEMIVGDRRVHEVQICGLQPNRTYYYQVGGEGLWSDVYSFRTAPEWGSEEPFTFGVTGDSRSPTQAMWGQALDGMEDRGAELVLFSGDAVLFGNDQGQWDVWWSQSSATATHDRLASMPLVYAHGNHDLVGDPMWTMMAHPRDEQNFYYRYGNALIIVLDDSGTFRTRLRNEFEIKDFLREALEAHPDATWRFVVHHKPIYSASTRHGSQRSLQEAWMPLYEEHGVDVVFNGHDHNYERSCSVRNQQCVADGQGTVYVVAAGIGADLYGNGQDWWTVKSQRVPTYMMVEVNGRQLSAVAYDLDGNVVDSFTLRKR
jgi:hypothetical protein